MRGRAGMLSRSPSPPEDDDQEEGDADLSLHIVNESQHRKLDGGAVDDPLDYQYRSPTYSRKWADLYASASELVDDGKRGGPSNQGDAGKVVFHGSDISSQSTEANGGGIKLVKETGRVVRMESSPEEGELQDEREPRHPKHRRTSEEMAAWKEEKRAQKKKRGKCKPSKKTKKGDYMKSGAPSGAPQSFQEHQGKIETEVEDERRQFQDQTKEKGSVIISVQSAITEEVVDENAVMRKLLRGRRYFDPPDEGGDSCNNCGQVGHLEADCSEERQRKPCYVCGDLGHDGWFCPQNVNCYACGKAGHMARSCPNRRARDVEVCMRCGDYDHATSRCRRDYSADDLQHVKCYVCKDVGHLSCRSVLAEQPTELSCYNCGELGHTGDNCRTSELERSRGGSHFKADDAGRSPWNSRRRQGRQRDDPWKDNESSPAGRSRGGNDSLRQMDDQVDIRRGRSVQDHGGASASRESPHHKADYSLTRPGRRSSSHHDDDSRVSKKQRQQGQGSRHHRSQDGRSQESEIAAHGHE